jgi:HD-like signal output (HDOD) protein
MTPRRLLDKPLPSLAAWTLHFERTELPVLADTARVLAELAQREEEGDDAIDAHLISREVSNDPLLALRLLAYVSRKLGHRAVQIDSVRSALVLLGIGPFFREFQDLPTLESLLADDEEALEGARDVLRRGERAARFALGFAVHRMDSETTAIHLAALLHDFAELLLWVHAPVLAKTIRRMQQADPTLRSVEAQRMVLGISLGELQQALMKSWRLPELLVRLSGDRHEHDPSVMTVRVALQVARHTSQGWQNVAMPDDVAAVASLLQLSPLHAHRLLLKIDN